MQIDNQLLVSIEGRKAEPQHQLGERRFWFRVLIHLKKPKCGKLGLEELGLGRQDSGKCNILEKSAVFQGHFFFSPRNHSSPGNPGTCRRVQGSRIKKATTLKTVTSLNKESRLLNFHFSYAILVFGDNELKCSKCSDRKAKIAFRTSKCCNR